MKTEFVADKKARRSERVLFGALILAHVAAVVWHLPPSEVAAPQPLLARDHPAHSLRVQIYREAWRESGATWGVDPRVSAGYLMRPMEDSGAKPQEFLGVLLPFLTPGSVVRLFLFVTVLLCPLWTLLAAWRLGLPWSARLWILVTLLLPLWLFPTFWTALWGGMAAFTFTAMLGPLVLVLFVEFLSDPSRRRYLTAFLAMLLQSMLHVLGPVLTAPVMLAMSLAARSLDRKWKALALAAPLIVALLNAFWLAPFLLDFRTPPMPSPEIGGQTPDMTYTSSAHLLLRLTPLTLSAAACALGLAVYGLRILRQLAGGRVAVALGAAAALGMFLKLAGSFLPVIVMMQPGRFLIAAFVLLTIPVGLALDRIAAALRVPGALGAGVCAALAVAVAAFGLEAGSKGNASVPFSGEQFIDAPPLLDLPQPPDWNVIPAELTRFIAEHTDSEDRILMQTRVHAEQTGLAALWSREIVGNHYPDPDDAANFRWNSVWGRELKDWTPEAFRESCRRWGVSWVITFTGDAGDLAARALDYPGEAIGGYRVFRTGCQPSRFLVGAGQAHAAVNRIELRNVESDAGLVVLRYRYHPAWEASSSTPVLRYAAPEDPRGFIALKDPPENLVLHFRPWKLFSAEWPAAVSQAR